MLGGFDVHAAWRDMVAAARQTSDRIEQPNPFDAYRTAGPPGDEPPAVGLAGGCDRASWHCPQCGDRAHFLDAGREPNAFAVALRAYAAHIAAVLHDPSTDDEDDASTFYPLGPSHPRGALDSRHTVIGRFGPGGSTLSTRCHRPRPPRLRRPTAHASLTGGYRPDHLSESAGRTETLMDGRDAQSAQHGPRRRTDTPRGGGWRPESSSPPSSRSPALRRW